MVKTDTNLWRLFKKGTAVGVVFFLVVVSWIPTAEAKVKSEWSRVQKVKPETKTTVVLYTDRAPQGERKVKGHFHSATPGSITVRLNRGQTRTLGKQAVFQVLVGRPPYEGLITAGASTGIFLGLAPGWDLNGRGWALFGGLFVGVPTGLAFLLAPKTKTIYYVPRKLRDDPAPEPSPPPDKQSSSTTASSAKDAPTDFIEAGSEGYFLPEEAGPELLRWHARQALLRKRLDPPALSGLDKTLYRVHGVSRSESGE